ncbi:MAG: DUF5711 family protein [Lachnospiraceae bacterium]|jgi:hypothetical protein
MRNIWDKMKSVLANIVSLGKNKDDDISQYKAKVIRHRIKSWKRIGIIVLLLLAAAGLVSVVMQKRVYHKYTVMASSQEEDTVATSYAGMGKGILKYTSESASFVDSKGEVVWNQTYEMQNPVLDQCEDTAVIADIKGSSMYMFDTKGQIGSVETTLPILKAKVAAQGVVVAILEDGEKTWVNFYSSDGTIIAENQTRIDSPGYPTDVAISPNGLLIMVTYLYVENGATTSYVAFYNFGDAGQNEIDNLVSGYTYEGLLVPQVEYLTEDTALAFREDGFSVYKGNQIPEESQKIECENEIVSTFCNSEYIGMVFKNDGKDDSEEDAAKAYTMTVYTTGGRQVFAKDFDIAYKEIKLSDDMIIMNNDSQVCLMSLKGVEKFNGNLEEGAIRSIFKTASNRYMVVTDTGVHTIKFK